MSAQRFYGYRLARQIYRECVAWSLGQFVALIIAILSAWAALHWGLVPIGQTRAAYIAYIVPFVTALVGYAIVQLLRAPYVLDKELQADISRLTVARDNWRQQAEAVGSIISTIDGMQFVPISNSKQCFAFIDVTIRNRGPDTSIHNWNARHRNAHGHNTHLYSGMFIKMERRFGSQQNPNNFANDKSVIVKGSIRSGWVGFHMSKEDLEALLKGGHLLEDLDLSFEDTFGHRHPVTAVPTAAWRPAVSSRGSEGES